MNRRDWYAVGCFALAGMFSAFMDTRQWIDPNIIRSLCASLGVSEWYAPVDAHVWRGFGMPLLVTLGIGSALGVLAYIIASERRWLFVCLAFAFVFYCNDWAIWDFWHMRS